MIITIVQNYTAKKTHSFVTIGSVTHAAHSRTLYYGDLYKCGTEAFVYKKYCDPQLCS